MVGRRAIGAALVALALGGLAALPAKAVEAITAPYTVAAAYDGVATTSLHIPSFDGTRLAITVYRPTRAGRVVDEKLPVVVTQARSDSRPLTLAAIRYFTERGYVWVAQDRRGTGASFGVQTGFVNREDAKDAKAVIEWATAQPYTTGKAVAFGCSNQGAWQYVVMKYAPKGLVAIAPACASAQFFDHGISLNGVPMLPLAKAPYAGECNRPPSGARPTGSLEGPAARAPDPERRTLPVDGDSDGALLKAAQAEQRCGAGLMGQYWLNMPRDGYNAFAAYQPALDDTAMTDWQTLKATKIAIMQIGGWYDAAVAGQFEAQRVLGGKVIMGPWVHGNQADPAHPFPGDALDINAEILRWFDHYAKGVDNGADRPGVVYYTQNARPGAEWREAAVFPAPARRDALYFTVAGLSRRAPSAKAAPATYAQQEAKLFDGRYTPLRRLWNGDMASFSAKALNHTLEPLAEDAEVTGAPTARLWVAADTPDANVFIVLEDVAPDGRSTYVTDGRLRASWRKPHPTPWGGKTQVWHRGHAADLEPLAAGKPELLEFDLFPVSYVFKKGHRIRVSLATSIGEAYQAPPLAGGRAPTLTLYRDAARPSSIVLPIVNQGS